jgi:hypothetical protein
MNKLISIPFKTLLRRLHNGEHYFFFNSNLIRLLTATVGNLPALSSVFTFFTAAFGREDNLYKQSQAWLQTDDIKFYHDKRSAFYSFFWYSASMKRYSTDNDVLQAMHSLLFLENTYRGLPEANYADQTGMITNFLQACESNTYKPLVQLLGLQSLIDEVRAAHNSFITLYDARILDKEHVAQMGKLANLRLEVDEAFGAFVEVTNSAWLTNELGAKDPAVKTKLLEVRDIIDGAIHQTQENMARRGVHHKHKDDKPGNGGGGAVTQTPDTTNPPAPDTPPQTPNITPPPIDPDELNPPSVGER